MATAMVHIKYLPKNNYTSIVIVGKLPENTYQHGLNDLLRRLAKRRATGKYKGKPFHYVFEWCFGSNKLNQVHCTDA